MYINWDNYKGEYIKNTNELIGRLSWNSHGKYAGWIMILDILDHDDNKSTSTGGDRTVYVAFKNGVIKRTTLNLVRRGEVSGQKNKKAACDDTEQYTHLLRAYPPALWGTQPETPEIAQDVLYAGKIYTINIPGLGSQKVLSESADAAWALLRSRSTIEEAL
jgi:hypothetical protein